MRAVTDSDTHKFATNIIVLLCDFEKLKKYLSTFIQINKVEMRFFRVSSAYFQILALTILLSDRACHNQGGSLVFFSLVFDFSQLSVRLFSLDLKILDLQW